MRPPDLDERENGALDDLRIWAKPQRHSAIVPSDVIRMGRLARGSPGAAAMPHVRSRRADPPQDKRAIA